MSTAKSDEQLLQEITELQTRLAEAEETLRAIHSGEVDALVVSTTQGNQIFTLQSADQPYRLLVQEMQQGAVTISANGTILYCNRYFAGILGYASSTLVSSQIDQYIVLDEREAFNAFLRTIPAEGGAYHEFNFQSRTNQIIPVHIAANFLQLDQTQVNCLSVSDLSQRKQAEQQTIALAIEKQRAKLLADFALDTSHDLRTPITSILTGLYLIQRIQDETQRNEKILDVEHRVFYLHKLLEQFQQMAILNSITEFPLQINHLNKLIVEVVSNTKKQADEKQIAISSALEEGISAVHGDPDMLHRALVELIENAIRFTPQGGHIEIRSAAVNDHQLMLEVVDNGIGISPDHLPHIFEHFFKADGTRKMTGGAGLGLSMVKRIVELHHGFVEVKSVPGEKTVFRIILPAVVSDASFMSNL